MKSKLLALVLAFAVIFGLSACSDSAQPKAEQNLNSANSTSSTKTLVATTTMLYDMANVLVGDQLNIIGLMNTGVDPHLYQASAGDAKKLNDADVVLYQGLHLEGQMGELFAKLESSGKNVIAAGEMIDKSKLLADEDNSELHDPHIWFSIDIWTDATKKVAEELKKLDFIDKDKLQVRLENYLKELEELEKFSRDRISEIPELQRVLITAHDAFRYFGRDYGFTVKGLQGISTEAEAGTADVEELASFIAENKIKAIFIESSVPHKNIEAVQAAVKAKGFEVGIGGELYSDSLGDKESGHDTYIETIKANINTIVDALK